MKMDVMLGFFYRNLSVFIVPPKVEYAITERGIRAIQIINIICEYGLELMKEFGIDKK